MLPLEGIRVLEWTAFQQGPIAACHLADMGAEVIKIEDPVGEPGRGIISMYGVKVPLNHYFQNHNRGKKGIVLNLKTEKGREILYKLAVKSDVFVTNYRESICKRLKVDYDTLRQYNSKLIYAYSSGYGPKGPDADLISSDFTGQARGGLWSISKSSNLEWTPIGAGMADEMGGFVTAFGIVIALFVRERIGIGQRVDASLLSGQIELGRASLQQYLFGLVPAPSPIAMLRSPLYNIYRCKDDKWICFGTLQADRYWPQFCKVLGIEELQEDPRFKDSEVRGEHFDELLPKIKSIFLNKPRDEWLTLFIKGGVAQVVAVQDYADVSSDPQVLANNYIIEIDDDIHGHVKIPGIPVNLSETPGKVRSLAPELGQHTEEVLMNILNYTWEDLSKIREEGVY